jgi:virginiamycin A acetyltransferase
MHKKEGSRLNIMNVISGTLNRIRNKYYAYKKGINCKEHIFISKKVELSSVDFGDYCNIAHHVQISNSKIGSRTSIGRYSKIRDAVIGSYCSISWDVTIGAINHPLNTISTHSFTYKKQFGIVARDINVSKQITTIGHDVWIGCNAIILPGVSVGNGAIIGAGAVVTKDVKPYSIVVGVPAQHLRYRFDKEICFKLNETKWWELPDEVLKANLEMFREDLNEETILKILNLCRSFYHTKYEMDNS